MKLIEVGAAGIVLAAVAMSGPAAQGADLKVLAATPMTGVVNAMSRQFEDQGRHKLEVRFVSGPIVKREIDAGANVDLAISITRAIDELIKDGKLVAETRVAVAYAVVGLGVRAGARKPDISTVEAFKQALLDAKSVAHSATGASGDHFKAVLQKLGIAEAMQGKLRPMSSEAIAQAVPTGQAEMIVVTASVILVPGAEFVGPIPSDLQFYNSFAAAVGTHSRAPEAAQAFIRLLAGPAAEPVLKSFGMQPGLPK